ncbi:ice-binding family protein [Kaistella jeonii]|uniref:ice-binding family protein n=1 Tax=Kaistella jeonii TaxID=266749 RepID=UPI00068A3D73|nr:ice-binding family protein [Kaistella jeonii]SFB71777.1 Por secretion system C-terminal sorting domain-containing protein [Kaistella jeonii]VEI94915.1 Por secretion system C-terminal sorting domain [Kaistella jeonii]
MKKILFLVASAALMCFNGTLAAQAPNLGTSANFALFSTDGAVTNTGLSHLTGNVGTNNGSSTNFGNVDGVMHDSDGTTAIAAADLLIAYNQLNAAIPNYFPAPLLGNGQIFTAGTYAIGQTASLNNTLTLDGGGNANAVFIFKVQGAFSSSAGSKVVLTNGALACNVFWKIEGLVDLATNTEMKGTIVANNAAIVLNTGVAIEGRALSTTGAVTVAGVTVAKPIGCGSAVLTGPLAPQLKSVACYTIFTGTGEVTNAGISFVTGDIGSNLGLTTGFQATNVTGTIHPNPDTSTATCAADLNTVYTYLNTLPVDIELLYPAAFGQNLVLTPHTYLLNAETVLNGTVILNAQNNPDAVFVIKIVGALSTSTYASVVLTNQAQAKNVYWKVDGAININDYANFKGTLIGNNGAVILNNGVAIEGRVLSTSGAVSTFAINAQMTPGCTILATNSSTLDNKQVLVYPNPFSTVLNVTMNAENEGAVLTLFNAAGARVSEKSLTGKTSKLQMNLPAGVYFYQVKGKNGTLQSGKLIAKP